MRRGVLLVSSLILALAMNGEALAAKAKNDEASTKAPTCSGNCKAKEGKVPGHEKPVPLTEAQKRELREKAAQHVAEIKERKENTESQGPGLTRLHAAGGGSKSNSNWLHDKDKGGIKF